MQNHLKNRFKKRERVKPQFSILFLCYCLYSKHQSFFDNIYFFGFDFR